MTQNTNLNISPYFDDFDANKNYNKVLFKPGFPVQARELTTLQTILQNQIEKFGQYFFKEGSIVIPGGTLYDNRYFAVRIESQFLNVPVNAYTKVLADNKIKIKGEISGVTATVVNRITEVESEDNFNTLYVKYTGSGSDGETREFQDGENLITLSDIPYANTKISANSTFAKCNDAEATKTGCSASITEGIYFIRGYFVKVPTETIVLDQYSNSPSYKIGLAITEKIISASATNPDLYDNAQGFSNEAAPGADRFSLDVKLTKKLLTDPDDKNFIELIRVNDGVLEAFNDSIPEFNLFADALARRTYEESGDYYVRPFSIDVRESLNDRISNRGLYLENQTTQNGNTPSDDIFCLQMSPGRAYVRGHRVNKDFTSAIDSVKPRTTNLKEDVSVPVRTGNVVSVNNLYGAPKIGFTSSTQYAIDLLDRRLASTGLKETAAETIGKARVYDWMEKDITTLGFTTTKYEARLYDIQLYTKINVGFALTTTANDHVEGKYSGAIGFVVSSTANSRDFSLQDVRGQFHINEPLLLNGVDIGRNVGVSTDHSFEDVKAIQSVVGINTFAADLDLDRKKQVFSEGVEFVISGGNSLASGSVADFTGQLHVGDIISYGTSGESVPTFNRVTSVAQNTVGLAAVADVSGVCDGSVNNSTPTGVSVVIPTLNDADKVGFRVPLADRYVSSMNVLDSSYVLRKQLDGTSNGSGVLTFDLASLNDDNLFFEPYTSDDFILNHGPDSASAASGDRINLQKVQVTEDAGLRTLTISGLSASKPYTLTATLKRSKLYSKSKKIVRCSDLIVRKSKYDGSGIGVSFSFNDGLNVDASGSVIAAGNRKGYGTRVQDREISLNYPDIHRVLAVFESNDTTDPTLPSLTVNIASQSDVFTGNNVTIGEQIIGNSSGALARVVRVVSSNQLEYVYENEKRFEVQELITLKSSSIVGNISILVTGDRNILSDFNVDKGHRAEFVDYGRLVRKKNSPEPTRRIRIIFDYYSTDESVGSIETVGSYDTLDYTTEIPFVIDNRASDFIDLRPRVSSPYSGNASPFTFANRDFTGSKTESLVSNKSFIVDYSHYLGRIDRLYLTKDGIFELKKGEPSIKPKAPTRNDEGFEVALITMEPYLLNAGSNVGVKLIPHKRYTMSDIGGLEHRIKNLENYTTLSLLETDTKNLSIKDPNTGLDKFKSGFFVDNFRNHASHNLTGESQFDIDLKTGECRPRTTERNVSLVFETKSSKLAPKSTDYRFVTDFDNEDIVRKGAGLTLKYDEVEFINQPLATRVENLNPFAVVVYSGTLELTPASDFWIDEIVGPAETINMGDGVFNAIAEIMGVEDRENGGMSTGVFNSTETTWGEAELISEEIVDSTIVSQGEEETVRLRGNGVRDITTRTDIVANDFLQTFSASGIEKTFGAELTVGTENVSLGPKVTGTEVLYNCRSRNIEVVGTRLKPNTRYYVFMENVDVTEWCVPKLIPVTMVRGSFEAGDTITNVGPQIQMLGVAGIDFRAAQVNHRFGPYNSPTETYALEPYTQSELTSAYSATSNVINVDTYDLADQRTIERSGWVTEGMRLANTDGTAECTVNAISLMSDDFGNLIFSLHIPDPSIASNPKFTTGLSTIRVTTSSTNAAILDPGEASAQTTYLASGYAQYSVEQTLSIKTPQVERMQIGTDQPVTRITTDLNVEVEEQRVTVNDTGWFDPLAQSFIVPRDKYADGMYITSGELYFKSKDDSNVTVQIRELDEGGRPSMTVVPFAETTITPGSAAISNDGSVGTGFTFSVPVYLRGDGRYALTIITPTIGWNTFITRMGEPDLLTDRLNDKQPSLGSLFKSQNNQLWTASQQEDLKFKLNKAKFVTGKSASVVLYNHDLALGRIRKENPIVAYSKQKTLSITQTTRKFDQGTKIEQTNSGVTSKGYVLKSGGPLDLITPANSLTVVADTGTSLTNGTHTGVPFTTLSGIGAGAVATVVVGSGAVSSITVTTAGNGYAQGDLLVSGKVGPSGSGVRAVVGVVTYTDRIVLEDVNEDIKAGVAITHFNSSSVGTVIAGGQISAASTDSVRDGLTMQLNHRNHGMHSSSNKVKIEGLIGEKSSVQLADKIDDNTTIITVNDASLLTTFEGSAVGAGNSGHILIGKEIISYEGANTSTGELTNINRSVDNTLRTDHKADDSVYKYEFNGVSLRKINKTHNISPKAKTFDTYHIELSDTNKFFESTKIGGGDNLRVSQNVPFEAINPKINSIAPTGTDIKGRIKTISGTSMSGTEASFTDKGYEAVALNKLNFLSDPRIVASAVNEYELLNNEKSFALELTLSTNNENVSPMIDLNRSNIIVMSNLVDSKVSDFTTDSRPRIPGQDPNTGIYETKKIELEFPSNSIYVQFDGHREPSADFRVFYKLYRNDSQDFQQHYIPFNSDGSPDKTVVANNRPNTYSEYKYTGENLPQFTAFMVKVVMTSTNQAQAPRFKNFRSIALRSFDIQ